MTNSGDVPPYADSEIIMKPTDDLVDRLRFHAATLDRLLCIEAADRIEALEAALRRCQTVLSNMALEDETSSVFKRWAIHHEPLRNDARNLLPVIDAALDKEPKK